MYLSVNSFKLITQQEVYHNNKNNAMDAVDRKSIKCDSSKISAQNKSTYRPISFNCISIEINMIRQIHC